MSEGMRLRICEGIGDVLAKEKLTYEMQQTAIEALSVTLATLFLAQNHLGPDRCQTLANIIYEAMHDFNDELAKRN